MASECTRLAVREKMTSISQENGKCQREKEVAVSKKGKSKDKANKDGKRSYSRTKKEARI